MESSEQFQTEIDFKPVSIPIKKLVMFFESGFKLYDFNKYPNLQLFWQVENFCIPRNCRNFP